MTGAGVERITLTLANGAVHEALAAGPAGGELVLLLHGFPETSFEWRAVLPALATWRQWLLAGLASALSIDIGLFLFNPSVDWYVGLSGVLHGFWSAGVLLALQQRRMEAIPLALLLLIKLGYEWISGPIPLSGEVAAGPVVTEAHLWGAIGGAMFALSSIAVRRR